MTDFDRKIGMGNYAMTFGKYTIEVYAGMTVGDVIDELKNMAQFLVENGYSGRRLAQAAKYFNIPDTYAEEMWYETKQEYRQYHRLHA